jgi:hypothetical protein
VKKAAQQLQREEQTQNWRDGSRRRCFEVTLTSTVRVKQDLPCPSQVSLSSVEIVERE